MNKMQGGVSSFVEGEMDILNIEQLKVACDENDALHRVFDVSDDDMNATYSLLY